MEIRQLRYFISIAEAKSYINASKSLFVTQPTLTWNIQKLEQSLNTTLFNQKDRNLELTETGMLLYQEGKLLLEQYDELIHEIQHFGTNKKGIQVGITPLFALEFMQQISFFISKNPDLKVSIIQNGSKRLQQMVVNEDVEIGLVSYPIYESQIEIEPLKTKTNGYKVSVVVHKKHPLANQKSISISDLKEYSLCTLSEDFVLGNIIYDRCIDTGFQPDIVFKSASWEALLQNVLLTENITLLPTGIKKISNFQDLLWIPLKDKMNAIPIGIAMKKNSVLSSEVIAFLEEIKKN